MVRQEPGIKTRRSSTIALTNIFVFIAFPMDASVVGHLYQIPIIARLIPNNFIK
jgi:hypothetical protein